MYNTSKEVKFLRSENYELQKTYGISDNRGLHFL